MSKGISRNQESILRWMGENSGRAATTNILQKVIPASRPSLARALASLEKRGLIKRLGGGNYQLNFLANSPASASVHVSEGVFVGRQRELGELTMMLEDALSGRGRLAMLVGEPGIGKTRTAQELAAYATRKGAQVLWGRCHSAQGAPPYWPWIQAIRSYIQEVSMERLLSEMGEGAADIAEVVPDLRQKLPGLLRPPVLDSPEAARFRLFHSIITFLQNAGRNQPLVLILDNLHWADQPSLLLLEFLAQELTESPLLVVGTYRDAELTRRHPLTHALGELAREPLFRRITLRGLNQEEVSRYMEVASGAAPPVDLLEAVHTQTEGNPLFMTQVVRLLAQEDGFAPETVAGSPGWRIQIPAGVHEAIGRRLSLLSERCNQVLMVASVVGREFDSRLLELLEEEGSTDNLLEVLEEALTAHVIEELPPAAGHYRFTHVLIQNTLARELSTLRQARLHQRIGEALEQLYRGDAENHAVELAYHFAEAASGSGTEKLVRYSLLAGEQALATYAHEEALVHFERALVAKEGQPMDAETAALLAGTGRIQVALAERHEMQEALDNLIQAFDYYAGKGDVERAVAVAQSQLPYPLLLKGKVQLLARALDLVPPDSREAGSLLPNYGRELGMCEADYEGAQRAFKQGLAIALREQDTALELRILASGVHLDLFNLNFHESLEKGFRAIALAPGVPELGFEEEHARRYTTLSLLCIGDLERARQQAKATLQIAEQLHQRSLLGWAEWLTAEVAFLEGDWEKARGHSDRALLLMPKAMHILAQRAHLECELGDFSDAEKYLDSLLEVQRLFSPAPSLEFAIPAILIPVMARISSRFDRLDAVSQSADAVLGSPYVLPRHSVSTNAGLAILAMQRGDSSACWELYAALKSQSGTLVSLLFFSADRLLGLLAQTLGNQDQAAAHFEEALDFCRKAGYKLELAWSCCDYADMMLVGAHGRAPLPGDRGRAISLLEEGLAITRELGMRPLTERMVALQERVASQPGPAPAYPDGLTQREMEVLRIIALGRSNQEIAAELVLSLRTVERHITNIYGKINARGRAGATAYALGHDLVKQM